MADPSAVADDVGEWIELYNPGTRGALDLDGCSLADGGRSQHPIASSLPIAAGGYVTIGRGSAAGVAVDLVLDISLANGSDTIGVYCGDVEIDAVSYDASFPVEAGKSSSLAPEGLSADANDLGSNWCAADAPLGTQFGTPGLANGPCRPISVAPPTKSPGGEAAAGAEGGTPPPEAGHGAIEAPPEAGMPAPSPSPPEQGGASGSSAPTEAEAGAEAPPDMGAAGSGGAVDTAPEVGGSDAPPDEGAAGGSASRSLGRAERRVRPA